MEEVAAAEEVDVPVEAVVVDIQVAVVAVGLTLEVAAEFMSHPGGEVVDSSRISIARRRSAIPARAVRLESVVLGQPRITRERE